MDIKHWLAWQANKWHRNKTWEQISYEEQEKYLQANINREPLLEIDENALNETDRLGLAYCRFNTWIWDEGIAGPCPDDFGEQGNPSSSRQRKLDYCGYWTTHIAKLMSAYDRSRCWWIFQLGTSEESHKWWWYSPDCPWAPTLCGRITRAWLHIRRRFA